MPITNPSWIQPIEITFDEGKPIRSEQGLMLAGNPIAMAEGAAGAPVVEATWHATDSTTIGGGSALIYDHDVDGDVAEILSPTLEAGYDYRLIGVDLESDAVGGDVNIEFGLSGGAFTSGGAGVAMPLAFDAVLQLPMVADTPVSLIGYSKPPADPAELLIFELGVSQYDRFRLVPDDGDNINAGKLWLLRRKVEGF